MPCGVPGQAGACPSEVELPVHPQATMPEGLDVAGERVKGGTLQVAPQVAEQDSPVAPPVTAPVNDYVLRLLRLLAERGAQANAQILAAFGLKDRRRMRETYIVPTLNSGLVEMTLPDKSNSRLQKCRLTDKGVAYLKATREAREGAIGGRF